MIYRICVDNVGIVDRSNESGFDLMLGRFFDRCIRRAQEHDTGTIRFEAWADGQLAWIASRFEDGTCSITDGSHAFEFKLNDLVAFMTEMYQLRQIPSRLVERYKEYLVV